MNSIAIDCERWVKKPSKGKGSSGQQIHIADKALNKDLPRDDRVPHWRIREAFYGRAGNWKADGYMQLRNAYERWEARREALKTEQDRVVIEALLEQRQRLTETDPVRNQRHVAALDYALQRLGGED